MAGNYTYVDHLQVLLAPCMTAAYNSFWYADEELRLPVPLQPPQVIKGFCDKSDGKDKLTALIQVCSRQLL